MKKNPLLIPFAVMSTMAVRAIVPPTMGWASWNAYRVNISEEIICKAADEMLQKGLKDVGYDHINIDDGFFGGRDADGCLVAHPTRFPRGLKSVADYVHGLGFKAGIYSDAGQNTCGNFWDNDTIARGVGFYGHDRQDAEFYFKDMSFDYIKVDFCGGDPAQNSLHLDLDERERYMAIRKAITKTGCKQVRMDICRWAFPGTWVHNVGNAWRISADIRPSWNSIKYVLGKNRYLSAFADGRGYNDMDMLVIGFGLSPAEERTHFGMWCIQSSPLFVSCKPESLSPFSLELLKNKELIALNQDPLGLQARVVRVENDVYLYVKDIEKLNDKTRAVAICNLSDEERSFHLDMRELGLSGTVRTRDLFTCMDMADVVDGQMDVTVPAHDTRIYRLEAEERLERIVYEAETAWMERFQDIGMNNSLGYAKYEDAASCSGGGKVAFLGNHPDNYLEWRDVYSREGGLYDMNIRYIPCGGRFVYIDINGKKNVRMEFPATEPGVSESDANKPAYITLRISLQKGNNTIRLSNPEAWAPDIDCMTLKKVVIR